MAQLTYDKLIHTSIRDIDTHTLPIMIIQWFNYFSVSIHVIVINVTLKITEYFVCLFMQQYFQTTYKFMELSPHALIPMHGRVNLWPKHMLCGYLKYAHVIFSISRFPNLS